MCDEWGARVSRKREGQTSPKKIGQKSKKGTYIEKAKGESETC